MALLGVLEHRHSAVQVQRRCILVGELLVWNDRKGEIILFSKIRRYVSREGRHLGCAQDSPPCEDEHLMIMFYDLLVVDISYVFTSHTTYDGDGYGAQSVVFLAELTLVCG